MRLTRASDLQKSPTEAQHMPRAWDGPNRLFEQARRIASADVARSAGLDLRRHGGREWTRCPLHGEKTASLCFYPDGGWYCFGCHAGGDAVDLYAALHHVTAGEAARELTGERGLPRVIAHPRRRKKREFLSGADDDGFTWDRLSTIYHAACSVLDTEMEVGQRPTSDSQCLHWPSVASTGPCGREWPKGDTPRLWDAVAARAFAEERMDNLLMEELFRDEQ